MCNLEEIIIVNELIEHLNETTLIRFTRVRYNFYINFQSLIIKIKIRELQLEKKNL